MLAILRVVVWGFVAVAFSALAVSFFLGEESSAYKNLMIVMVALLSVIIGLAFQVVQSEERKKYENRVVELLEGILRKQGGADCIEAPEGHHSVAHDSGGQEGTETMRGQCRCYSKPDNSDSQGKRWVDPIVNTIPRALAFFALTVLLFVVTAGIWSLAGDHSVWGNEVALSLLAATSAVMVSAYKGRGEDKHCCCSSDKAS